MHYRHPFPGEREGTLRTQRLEISWRAHALQPLRKYNLYIRVQFFYFLRVYRRAVCYIRASVSTVALPAFAEQYAYSGERRAVTRINFIFPSSDTRSCSVGKYHVRYSGCVPSQACGTQPRYIVASFSAASCHLLRPLAASCRLLRPLAASCRLLQHLAASCCLLLSAWKKKPYNAFPGFNNSGESLPY